MDEPHLYRQLAEKVRQEILEGVLKPGDRLPPLRELAAQWGCTIGTVQHAYQELAQQGLVTSRAGQGTRVVERPSGSAQSGIPLRRAMLVHRAESFLLEAVTAGYSLEEIDSAVRQAMDRWRVVEQSPQQAEAQVLRFAGSHDLAVTWLAGIFPTLVPGSALRVQITGSLGGLLALANGQADLAGSHLWDPGTDSYNAAYVQRFFPGQRMALVTLAGRRLGLLTAPGNPYRPWAYFIRIACGRRRANSTFKTARETPATCASSVTVNNTFPYCSRWSCKNFRHALAFTAWSPLPSAGR